MCMVASGVFEKKEHVGTLARSWISAVQYGVTASDAYKTLIIYNKFEKNGCNISPRKSKWQKKRIS